MISIAASEAMLLFSICNITFAAFCLARAVLPDWAYDTADFSAFLVRFYAEEAYQSVIGWAGLRPVAGITRMYSVADDGTVRKVSLLNLPALLKHNHGRSLACGELVHTSAHGLELVSLRKTASGSAAGALTPSHLTVFYVLHDARREHAISIDLAKFKLTDRLIPRGTDDESAGLGDAADYGVIAFPAFIYVAKCAADGSKVDVTDHINKYAGPRLDFHKDVPYASKKAELFVTGDGLLIASADTKVDVMDASMSSRTVRFQTFGLLFINPAGGAACSDTETDSDGSATESDDDAGQQHKVQTVVMQYKKVE